MICVDANLLFYAHHAELPQHGLARAWFQERLNGHERVGLPWASLIAFVRLSANRRVLERPLSIQAAWREAEAWLDVDRVWIPTPTDRHREVLGRTLAAAGTHHGLVMDAHLAALAIEHGLILCSADRDFARFPGLRWENPLA